MYVPATPVPPAPPVQLQALASPAPGGEAPPAVAQLEPARTELSVRSADVNVLAGLPAMIAGALRAQIAGGRLVGRGHSGGRLVGPGLPGGRLAGSGLSGGRLAGTALGGARVAGRLVELQLYAHRRWRTVAQTHTGARGRYRLRYRTPAIGSELARVRFPGDSTDRGSHRRLGLLNVYRVVGASWYGGGGSLACGGSLTSSTLGVANKTLPCGTLVTLRYGGHTLRVPVIDRGPYVAGREFDLTEATKRTLGFEGTGDVWATG